MYAQNGKNFSMIDGEVLVPHLPIGLYNLLQNINGFYFESREIFSLPEKFYSFNYKLVDKILRGFESTDKNMGVYLCGNKGSGKTLMSQYLAIKSNLPVLLINEQYADNNFVNFIANINQPVVLLFDEFEKIYNSEESQNTLLTLLDGNFKTKILSIFTSNSRNMNDYFSNRLSRVKYKVKFGQLDKKTVGEIADDLLINKDHKDSLLKYTSFLDNVNIDLVIELIKEMNLFNEPADIASEYLNISEERTMYNMSVYDKFGRKYHIDCPYVDFSLSYEILDISYDYNFRNHITAIADIYETQDGENEEEYEQHSSHIIKYGFLTKEDAKLIYAFMEKYSTIKLSEYDISRVDDIITITSDKEDIVIRLEN